MKTTCEQDHSAQTLKQRMDEIVDRIQEYSAERKQEFSAAIDRQMETLDERIDHVRAQADSASGDAKQKLQRLTAKLQTKRTMFEARVKSMQAESGEAWLSLKEGVRNAWRELADAVESAGEAFRNGSDRR